MEYSKIVKVPLEYSKKAVEILQVRTQHNWKSHNAGDELIMTNKTVKWKTPCLNSNLPSVLGLSHPPKIAASPGSLGYSLTRTWKREETGMRWPAMLIPLGHPDVHRK